MAKAKVEDGGYCGGNQEPDDLSDQSKANIRSENGMCGNPVDIASTRPIGGGYFAKAQDSLIPLRWGGALGGGGGVQTEINFSNGGDGGIAGKGGTISYSPNCTIYAYNGNRYTDGLEGHETTNSLNQCPIYAQNGILKPVVKNLGWWVPSYNTFYSDLFGKEINFSTTWGTGTNSLVTIRNETTCNVTSYGQGIGSGAGYIELSNGTFTVDPSMN